MEFMLDTANIEEIKNYVELLPIAGVTSNPSIVKNEGKIDFFNHMKKIREILGAERSLHVQVVATSYEGMLKDAEAILKNIDSKVYIKVPVSTEGLKVIKTLKQQGINVTATAIYTKFQAYLAIAAGADYIAPYYNRMENLNIDPRDAVGEMAKEIARTNSKTKILAASFKNVGQVNSALENGAQAATMGVDIIKQAFAMPSIKQAVADFTSDWEVIFGEGVTISSLK
ncbi:transaldolase [Enterococcus sp. PF1-24]|uniref:fructose-6-phosphate aldolase n=1 Tax=unclassified Enterococcus TaxID=2608891 RepID=UPI0024759F48|nr:MULTISPECIES: fructose-6-phosphate aldolase [unclassified Enterococcus]MDH6363221.1 transaldolase [Enterococcus sp. PFB1-1]MDH6400478.1 transaldolase [Enterococcus sp. PF1-24]